MHHVMSTRSQHLYMSLESVRLYTPPIWLAHVSCLDVPWDCDDRMSGQELVAQLTTAATEACPGRHAGR